MKYSQKISSLVITTIIFFISFGIYIGRFLRFNSWDIFERPFSFMHAIGEIFTNRNYSIDALFYTLLFFFFISMSYYSWKYIQKND